MIAKYEEKDKMEEYRDRRLDSNGEESHDVRILVYIPVGEFSINHPGKKLANNLSRYPGVTVGVTELNNYEPGGHINVVLSYDSARDDVLKDRLTDYEGGKRVVLTTDERKDHFAGKRLDEVVEILRHQLAKNNSI